MQKVRWGILSTAKIAREKVIPAMQRAKHCEIVAIASRNLEQAQNRGMTIFWAHDLAKLTEFVEATRR